MAVSSIEGGRAGEGYLAGVDSRNRLMVIADRGCAGSDVTTTSTDVGSSSTASILSANDARITTVVQNLAASDVNVVFGTGNPTEDDLRIAAGAIFVVPFCWKGPIRAKRASGSGKVVVIETEESAS